MLLIHHTRKMRDPSDVFNELSGSVGVMGALDAALVISKDKRTDNEAMLHVTGRDMESLELSIEFNKTTMRWECHGTTKDVEAQKLIREYENSTIIRTIRKLLQTDGTWSGSALDIKNASRFLQTAIAEDPRKIGKKINQFEGYLWTLDGITFKVKKTAMSSVVYRALILLVRRSPDQ